MRFSERTSGVLLHISSLPSRYGIGDLGVSSHNFARTLADARQRYWQMLPVTPADIGTGASPYSSPSAFAGNHLFISPELLVEQGFLHKKDLVSAPDFSNTAVNYLAASAWKSEIFKIAFGIFRKHRKQIAAEFDLFYETHRHWLDDYALFAAMKLHFGGKSWHDWPAELRDRSAKTLSIAAGGLSDRIEYETFLQFLFFRQWNALKQYCNELGVRLIGDIPIYVSYDSVDVWANPEQYDLDAHKRPVNVAGVPPDYFSKTGQRWGNPLYKWDKMQADGFAWWVRRLQRTFSMFDLVRIDHFRGLVAYWSIPADEKTAVNGTWVQAPADEFLRTITKKFPAMPLIAEDLGTITAEVRETLRNADLPGMKVLQFAFGEDVATNLYAPHNSGEHTILYTGTHDNNTTRGWFEQEITPAQKQRLDLYAGSDITAENVHRHIIRLALCSAAKTVIIPVQDIIGAGADARMNTPGVAKGNWTWQLGNENYLENWDYLRTLTELFGRAQ